MSRRLLAALALLLAPAAAYAQPSPAPFMSGTRYDAAGRVTGTISADPDGVGTGNPFLAVRTTYDGAGRPTKLETGRLSAWQSESVAPAGWAGFTADRAAETQYDAMGRKIREWVREGSAGAVRTMTEYSYDAIGRPTCTAVRMNPAVFAFSGTPNACTPNTQGTAPNDFGPDRIGRNVYDAAGQRVQVRVGVGSGAEAAEATWAYNFDGQVTTMIDGNGNRAGLFYDGHGRQNCWMFPSTTRPAAYNDATQATALASAGSLSGGLTGGHCTSGDYEAYGYDPNGNRTSRRKRDNAAYAYGSIVYEYDALNRVTRKTVPERAAPHPAPLAAAETRDVFYGYDLRGLQLYARFDSAGGEGVTNAWDGFGRALSSSINLGGTTRTLTYVHDANGNRTRITHPDGNYFRTDFDGLNRPVGLVANGLTLMQNAGYYAQGPVASSSRANGTTTEWGYDGILRMSALIHGLAGTAHDASWTYAFNPASQIGSVTRDNDAYAWAGHYAVNRAYTTDGLNRYTAAGGASFAYDQNGNLTSDGSSTYAYDVENRLVARSGGVALIYDPLGRLFQVAGGAGTTIFLYDGDALVAEYVAGAMTRRYVHNVGADVPLLSYAGAGLTLPSYLHADHQGSIVAVSDPWGAGTLNRYDEYGIPAATNTGRFQYTGQIWLPELGMYHYKARIYSPYLGRFLQTDPVGYEDQYNLYAYVGNDPVNRADPSGECETQPIKGSRGEVVGQREVGICGTTDAEKDFIQQRIGDTEHSEIHLAERDAVARGERIDLRFVENDDNVRGGEARLLTYSDGSRGARVTIDIGDAVTHSGEPVFRGVETRRVLTREESAEHEIAGHARDHINRVNPTDARALDAENRYRQRMHINFRRTRHDDIVRIRRRR